MKRVVPIISSLMAVLVLCGCTNAHRLSDMTIVQALGIDGADDDARITLQYLDLSNSTGATDSITDAITSTATGSGINIGNAVVSACGSLSGSAFFGQNKVVLFGGDYARADLSKGMDYLLRSADSRPDVYVAVCRGTAADAVRSSEGGARIPAQSIHDLIDKSDDNGTGAAVTVNDLLNFYADATSDMFLPLLKVQDDRVVCDGIAVFRDNRYALTLSPWESFGFDIIHGRVSDGTMSVESDDMGTIGLVITGTSSHRSADVQDGDIVFRCDIGVRFVLNEVQNGTTVSIDGDRVAEIERLVSQKLTLCCKNAFNTCAAQGCDPFAVGRYLARSNSSLYQYYRDDWHNSMCDVVPAISVHAILTRVNDDPVHS